ncbi:DHA1 family chloramphenicol resistance protein-like MFS transporter [Streptomyces sp. 1114.5]|uniref:Cmx/CmrA family chloramphenicol efflux MFS transporter n=1 Tax=Streptomyces sp. 1114.5 TaxID=1938830 RepID=UPI000EB362EF|nr:Cmx/CmrA family chloramphenicol efflux MFS transporter [Streptomyces sp. 1114.5]RKT09749.1 DHA1 family chloramphenicol resistance protein-like MFS transporter [Streptomyces sp. 1114.5]
MPLPLYLLALAVFAMGTSEFMLAGLLPDLAPDLGVTVATAGLLTPAFAIGMVVGAPLVAALARYWPARSSLLGFVLVFATAHAVGAVTPNFPVLCATRVVAALANAGFLAVALTAAGTLVPADRKGRALAVLLSGTTMATIVGVPAGAVLGTALGWRAAFWAVAALCLPAAVGVLTGLPAAPAGARRNVPDGRPPLRAELAHLRRPRLLLVMLLGALVNAATFASFTFLAPVVTGTAGLGEAWVPVVLVLFGAGSFVGVTAAGRLSDRRPGLVLAAGGPLLFLGWPALAVFADRPLALLLLVFVQGALSFALGGTLISRVLYEAAPAVTMAGSYATAAFNLGAVAGPLIAATTLGTGTGTGTGTGSGDLGPLWVGALLVAVALLAALPARGVLTAVPGERSARTGRGVAPAVPPLGRGADGE